MCINYKRNKEVINTKFRVAVIPGGRGMWSGAMLWSECLCPSSHNSQVETIISKAIGGDKVMMMEPSLLRLVS